MVRDPPLAGYVIEPHLAPIGLLKCQFAEQTWPECLVNLKNENQGLKKGGYCPLSITVIIQYCTWSGFQSRCVERACVPSDQKECAVARIFRRLARGPTMGNKWPGMENCRQPLDNIRSTNMRSGESPRDLYLRLGIGFRLRKGWVLSHPGDSQGVANVINPARCNANAISGAHL